MSTDDFDVVLAGVTIHSRDAADGEPIIVGAPIVLQGIPSVQPFPRCPHVVGERPCALWDGHAPPCVVETHGSPAVGRRNAPCDMCETAPGFCPRHDQAPVVAGRRVEQG